MTQATEQQFFNMPHVDEQNYTSTLRSLIEAAGYKSGEIVGLSCPSPSPTIADVADGEIWVDLSWYAGSVDASRIFLGLKKQSGTPMSTRTILSTKVRDGKVNLTFFREIVSELTRMHDEQKKA